MAELRTAVTYCANGGDEHEIEWGVDVKGEAPSAALGLFDEGHPALDLFTIAGTCFVVDRCVPRPDSRNWRYAESEWGRDLSLRIPVQDQEFWSLQRPLLQRLLAWLTADRWSVEFTQARGSMRQASLPLHSGEGWTALFSGGLDSTAGITRRLGQHPRQSHRLVSVVTNNRMLGQQRDLFDRLYEHNAGLGWFPFHLHLSSANTDTKRKPAENTARTRGLVFLSAGLVTAIAHNDNTLEVYENGTGAINLMCTRGQVGAQAAKAVHPRTLQLMQRLATEVTGAPFTIRNPFAHTTKAQMLCSTPTEYTDALNRSVSCDTAFTHGEAQPCDWCTSCVLRRQAMAAARRPVSPPTGTPPYSKRDHTNAMVWQVARLRHAFAEGPSWQRLVREFPDVLCLPGAARPEVQNELMELLQTYLGEWEAPGVAEAIGFDPSLLGFGV